MKGKNSRQKMEGKNSRLRLKKMKTEEESCSPLFPGSPASKKVTDRRSGSLLSAASKKVTKKRSSDLTPVRQKVMDSEKKITKQHQFQRSRFMSCGSFIPVFYVRLLCVMCLKMQFMSVIYGLVEIMCVIYALVQFICILCVLLQFMCILYVLLEFICNICVNAVCNIWVSGVYVTCLI